LCGEGFRIFFVRKILRLMIFQIFCQKDRCELVVDNLSVFNKKNAKKYAINVEARKKN
jgi:hypothetical protein